MAIRIRIETEGAAFEEEHAAAAEVARLLRRVADNIDLSGDVAPGEAFGVTYPLHDVNGNRVGTYDADPLDPFDGLDD